MLKALNIFRFHCIDKYYSKKKKKNHKENNFQCDESRVLTMCNTNLASLNQNYIILVDWQITSQPLLNNCLTLDFRHSYTGIIAQKQICPIK